MTPLLWILCGVILALAFIGALAVVFVVWLLWAYFTAPAPLHPEDFPHDI